jgi:proteasome lid subunit RPN8/RPN11
MNFFTAATMRRLLAPRHELSCSWLLWRRLLIALRARGRERTRESGAFLLGARDEDGCARIEDFVLYDDLDPKALASGIVHFNGRYFSDLWAICEARDLAVVADVHVHPGGAAQSDSDRSHPMISLKGHLALILPDFADHPVKRQRIGIYRYEGAKLWQTIPPHAREAFFHIGF